MTKPKSKPSPRRWMRTTTVAIHDKDHEEDEPLSRCWVCDVKPSREKNRWAHRIIVNAPTDAECKKRADIIAEALNKGETK